MDKDSLFTSTLIPSDEALNICTDSNTAEPVLQTLAISVILLCLVSLIKYHTDKENEGKDYWLFFFEIPLDLGLVFISLFVSYYYLVSNINWLFIIAFFELLAILIGSIIRNRSIKKYLTCDNTIQSGLLLLFLFGEVLVVTAPAIFSLIKYLL